MKVLIIKHYWLGSQVSNCCR